MSKITNDRLPGLAQDAL